MDHQSIISAIDAEIARLQQVRTLLSKSGNVDQVIRKRGPKKAVKKAAAKRVLSAEARARIAAAQKKRWAAAKRAAK